MLQVAFFRNLNLGHARSPDRRGLLEAFEAAGAHGVHSFQTNGTVVFRADDPAATALEARARLGAVGYTDEVFVRDRAALGRLLGGLPAVDPGRGHYREIVTLHGLAHGSGPDLPRHEVPHRTGNGLVEILRLGDGYAFGLCWQRGTSVGDVTGHIERLLGTPATSRTLGTMVRLAGLLDRLATD